MNPSFRSPLMIKGWKPGDKPREMWIRRGGTGKSNNSGAAGRKMKPAAQMYRALAAMALAHGMVNGRKRSDARR